MISIFIIYFDTVIYLIFVTQMCHQKKYNMTTDVSSEKDNTFKDVELLISLI